MKIVRSNGSQLCNRLWSYAPIIGYSLSYNERIYILDFDRYSNLFPNLQSVNKVRFINSKFTSLCCKLYSYLKYKIKGEGEPKSEYSNKISTVFINGWDYRRSIQLITDNRESILKLFSPSECVVNKCISTLTKLREDNDIVVGVHIRRGDYKTFLNGKYYFEDDIYFDMMFQIKLLVDKKNSQNVKFLIASNEKINYNSQFDNCFQIQDSSSIEDLYLLSLCDYVIGPPSSFSMWASWYGSVPLRVINGIESIYSFDEFKIVSTIDIFDDRSGWGKK